MRRRLAIPLILTAAFLPWYALKPPAPPAVQPGVLDAVIDVPRGPDWLGGLSGIEVSADGTRFHVVTDRGHHATGALLRDGSMLTAIRIEDVQAIRDMHGIARNFPHTDAEGIALDAEGGVYISFEHLHRVLYFKTWQSNAEWPSYTRVWRSLARNQGLEALAIDEGGTLFTFPEAIQKGAAESIVFRRKKQGRWQIPFTLPVDEPLKPVGADFGPDGRLYVLERGIYPFAFYSRVRSMRVTEEGFEDIVTVLTTPLGRHGNLEGLSVWQDTDGNLRLTMVSDDNFIWFMRMQIVEYRIDGGLAQPVQ
jgi:hypothetical protein